jgi:triosephosphate isomerase
MNKKITLIGNWKMNLGPREASEFARRLLQQLPKSSPSEIRIWIAPPTISADAVSKELSGSPIRIGLQNVHWGVSGAFTGETSPAFAKDLGITFTLVGHSERRTLFGESSEQTALRMGAAIKEGLIPVVCIGESAEERERGETELVIGRQLEPVFNLLNDATGIEVILAYEPVWAIGTGKVATSDEIASTHAFIRRLWSDKATSTPCEILYGGSVNADNLDKILKIPGVDGALVGGASIKLDQWAKMITIAVDEHALKKTL